MKPTVAVLMGSDSDFEVMKPAAETFKQFGVAFDMRVMSAHRTPDAVVAYVKQARDNGVKVFIAGAGSAAHLGGVIAANTILPVIGVPIDSSALNGLDALLSTVQMPAGIPVAAVAIGKAGAKNAALLAVQILALSDSKLQEQLLTYRKDMVAEVEKKDKKLSELIKAL